MSGALDREQETAMVRKVRRWFVNSLQRKVMLLLVAALALMVAGFVVYDVQEQRNSLDDALLAKGQLMAQTGAQSISHVLQDAIATRRLSAAQAFDTHYQPIANT